MIRLQTRVIKREKTILFLFINRFIKRGFKDLVYQTFILVLIKLKRWLQKSFDQILIIILNNIIPLVELRPKFASGIVYFLPTAIKEQKSIVLGLTWLIKGVRTRNENNFKNKLLLELQDIINNKGHTLRLKQDYYKLILENRVLLHRFRKKIKK